MGPIHTLPSGLACSPCVPSSLTARATVQTKNDPHCNRHDCSARRRINSVSLAGRGICCIDQRQHDVKHCCHVNWTTRDSAADVRAVFARTESASSLAWRFDRSCATCARNLVISLLGSTSSPEVQHVGGRDKGCSDASTQNLQVPQPFFPTKTSNFILPKMCS